MGKHTITAGGEIDVIDEAQMRTIIEEAASRFTTGELEADIRAQESGQLDGTGAGLISIYTVPVGHIFRITRLVVAADGVSFSAPYTNAAGGIQVNRSGEYVDGLSGLGGGILIPAISVDNKDTGTRWRNGETVDVQMIGGPANRTWRVSIQGFLKRLPPIDDKKGRFRGESEAQ
jgi:hypothetical protein